MSAEIIIEDNVTECPACEGSGEQDCRPGNSGDHEVANDEGMVNCGRCGGVGYIIEFEEKQFNDLRLGGQFMTEHDGRVIVFRKFALGSAIVHHDPKGVWTGCHFPFGLLAPVKVEKS